MSMLTDIAFTNAADTRKLVDEVVGHAFQAVCSTMGPNGRYVVINQVNQPRVTKDGVSVAKALDFNESRKNLIAKIITEPSIKTDLEVGDGTTTTVFMMYQLYNMFKDKMSFRNVRFLDQQINEVYDHIAQLIIPGDIEDPRFRSMLLTSSNYEDEIVDKVLEIYRTHQDPNINLVKASNLPHDDIKFTKEIQFDGNFGSDLYVPASGGLMIKQQSAYVVIVDGNVQDLPGEFLADIENETVGYHVIIMARNFDPMAISQLNGENNRLKQSGMQGVKFIPYKLNAAGSLGSQTISDLGKLMNVDPLFDVSVLDIKSMLKIDVPFIVSVHGIQFDKNEPFVKYRADKVLELLDDRYSKFSIIDRQQPVGRDVNRRIGRLRANNVTISVSGVTVSDATERYYRYEDVMKAARTGLEFGVIPGIGYGYLMAREYLDALPQQSDEGLNQLLEDLKVVLTAQYEHLTENKYNGTGSARYVDLVTGEESDTPMDVYDNAAATLTALKGAWATAKTLGKLSNVMGKSNSTYS